MTKLSEWLFGLSFFCAVYTAIVTKKIKSEFVEENFLHFQLLPLYLIIMLGIYAVTTVLYRTFTFNNCEEAAEELQQQIKEARKDLKAKGFVFDN